MVRRWRLSILTDRLDRRGGISRTKSDMDRRIVDVVRAKYGSVAKSDLSSQNEGVRAVAEAFGYSAEQLASIPAEANMGLSCGNPTAFAGLKPGEVVVDLGCGGGLRRRARRIPRRGEGPSHGQGHRHRHGSRNDRPCPPERGQGRGREADHQRGQAMRAVVTQITRNTCLSEK
jgi:hypothetical protein